MGVCQILINFLAYVNHLQIIIKLKLSYITPTFYIHLCHAQTYTNMFSHFKSYIHTLLNRNILTVNI